MSATEASPARSRAARTRILRAALALAAVGALVAAALLLPLDRWLLAAVEWIRDAGAAGVVAYAALYVLSTVFLVPGTILTLGAGFAYGPFYGAALVSPVSVLAATASFLLGRTVARGWISSRVAADPRFSAIDEAIGRSGFRIVLLLRLSPVFPFNLTNYALGLTRVRLLDYVLASWIGMLPATFLFVYIGSLVTSAAELASGERHEAGPWGHVLLGAGLAATAAVAILVARLARRALRQALQDPRKDKDQP